MPINYEPKLLHIDQETARQQVAAYSTLLNTGLPTPVRSAGNGGRPADPWARYTDVSTEECTRLTLENIRRLQQLAREQSTEVPKWPCNLDMLLVVLPYSDLLQLYKLQPGLFVEHPYSSSGLTWPEVEARRRLLMQTQLSLVIDEAFLPRTPPKLSKTHGPKNDPWYQQQRRGRKPRY